MFDGFTKETVDFLQGIRENNNKEWFEAHKADYKKYVAYPLKEFGEKLFEPFAANPELNLKVCTIYRDAQCTPFTHYRDYMWICIRHDAMYWSTNPTLFFSISGTAISYGFTLWQPEPKFMERFRDEITDRPKNFFTLLDNCEKSTGLTLGGKEYKRTKPGFTEENERFFKLKTFEMYKREPISPKAFSKDLYKPVTETLAALLPLNEYFHELLNREKTPHKIRTAEEFEW